MEQSLIPPDMLAPPVPVQPHLAPTKPSPQDIEVCFSFRSRREYNVDLTFARSDAIGQRRYSKILLIRRQGFDTSERESCLQLCLGLAIVPRCWVLSLVYITIHSCYSLTSDTSSSRCFGPPMVQESLGIPQGSTVLFKLCNPYTEISHSLANHDPGHSTRTASP
jgi:hypothetical protein